MRLRLIAPAHGIKYSTIERFIEIHGYVLVISNNSDQRYRLDAKSGLSEPEFRNLISWMTNPWICISTPPKIVDMFTEAR